MEPIQLLVAALVIILVLVIVHYILQLVTIEQPVKNIIMIVVAFLALIWLLQRAGFF